MWLQVIDRPELPGSYGESSATAMFVYALLKPGRLGILNEGGARGRESLQALATQALRKGPDGTLRLAGICQVAGLGGFQGAYRDGSAGYYLSERVVEDDAKGVGPFIMAIAGSLRVTPNPAEMTEPTADSSFPSNF